MLMMKARPQLSRWFLMQRAAAAIEVKEQERDAQSAFPLHNEKRETNLCKKSFNGRSWNFRRAINRYERRIIGGSAAVKRKFLPDTALSQVPQLAFEERAWQNYPDVDNYF